MKFIGDFHIHSHYSRATSKDMNIEELDRWARIKGVNILGTGDFTHPRWFQELQDKLEQAESGLYRLKIQNPKSEIRNSKPDATRFILTVEIASIYSEGGKVRRIHNIIFAPTFSVARKINRRLSEAGNLRADGRPILGLPSKELLKIVLDASPDCMLVPAHCWTPWFSIFGSKSGYDSIEECFGEMSKHIYAVETGLSSDPAMNWRVSGLDNITLISNSDCHSARRIGREANIFEGEKLSYRNITDAIKYNRRGFDHQRGARPSLALGLVGTVEFFPEEGKYHYDGHRACGVSLHPKDSQKIKEICEKCDGPLTIGVLSRVLELADREDGYMPENAVPFRRLVPLDEIIAEALGVSGTQIKAVVRVYNNLIIEFGNEFNILLNVSEKEIENAFSPEIAEAIRRVRAGELYIEPGYDGEYGTVKIFKNGEIKPGKKQVSLF